MPENYNSQIHLDNKSCLSITGVDSVVNLTETTAGIIVCDELLVVKGRNLKAEKLSVETKELKLVGEITSLKFEEKHVKTPLLKRIFK